MAGIVSGQATTYNLPNYVGELFNISPEDTPLLSSIGGLTGGRSTDGQVFFEWQYYDLRDASDSRQRLEGGADSDGAQRVRSTGRNVVEIHTEWVEISYTRQATTGQRNTNSEAFVSIGGTRVPADELSFQVSTQIKQIARDVNKTFITGTYAYPSDNNSPRKTRGLLEAIDTNVATYEGVTLGNSSSVKAFRTEVLDLMQKIYDNGGISEAETRTLLVGSTAKRALTEAFVTEAGYAESTRNVGGVNLQTVETDFGRCNIMLDRAVPDGTVIVVSLEDLAPRFLEIPDKGHFFVEPVPVAAASTKLRIYGEIGLEYGNEKKHGKLEIDEES